MNQEQMEAKYDTDYVETVVVEEEEGPRRHGYWHKMGGGSLTVSVIIHGIFVVIAIFIFLSRMTPNIIEPKIEFLPGGGGGGEKLALKKQKSVTHAQPRMPLESVSRSTYKLPNVSSTMSQRPALTMVQMGGGGLGPGEGDGRDGGTDGGVGEGLGKYWGLSRGPDFIDLHPSIRSRCSPTDRAQKMKENGGNEKCESAVKKSLKWLQTKQNPDGSWGESHKGAMTGLALLAYLGHCETPESPLYGETVMKGLTYLMELGAKNKEAFEGIYSTKPGDVSSTYEHGIAAYAMGEMYSFSKLGTKPIPGLCESFEKAALIIINKQAPNGGWGYKGGAGYDQYGGNDLSVTGWQFQALKAAKHTNLKIPGLEAAIKKVEGYLLGKQTADGGFGDANRGAHYNQWNLSGAALLGLQTLGVGDAGKINKGIRWLTDQIKKEPRTWNADCYLYAWYYDTQALFQKGGEAWKLWNGQLQKEILENQNDDGSYKVESVGGNGSAGTGAAGGDKDVYRVCLCTLMLEVYYRYLKVADRGNSAVVSRLLPLK